MRYLYETKLPTLAEDGAGGFVAPNLTERVLSYIEGECMRSLKRLDAYVNGEAKEPGDLRDDTAKVAVFAVHLLFRNPKMLKVVLIDGSEVWVNAGSRLVYPTCFVGSQRCVDLEGEAYFKVAPDAAHPFVVKTPGSQTCVLGTEFNIKSYRNQTEQITLVRGSVEVTVGKHGESSYEGAHQSMVLKPGQQLSVHNRQLSVQEVDTDIYTYWKDGFFFYDDERLDEIMRQIGSWYNVSVVFRNPRPRSYKIHFFCDRSSTVEQVVEQLNMLHKGYLKLTEGVIYVD